MKKTIVTSILVFAMTAAAFGLLAGEAYAERAMWVWGMADDIVLNTNNAQTDFFNFCAAPHGNSANAITLIFMDAKPYGFNLLTYNSGATLRSFLSAAHTRGIKVEFLSGDKSWATPEGRATGENLIDEVTTFNLGGTSAQRFDGIQYDVEPYLLRSKTDSDAYDWDYDRGLIWGSYLTLLTNCQTKINNYNTANNPDIRFGAAIPRWYTPGSTNGPEPIIDRIDYVAIMDYRDQSGQIIADAQDEINYAVTKGKNVYIGVEASHPTDTVDFPPSTTFYEEGNTAMESQLATVNSTLSAYSSYAGIAIHYYEDLASPKGTEISYRSLSAGARAYHYPVVTVASPNKLAEVWYKGTSAGYIQWSASDLDGDAIGIKIEYSANGGSSWTTITPGVLNTGSYLWNTSALPIGSSYLIRIKATDNSGYALSAYDVSNSTFAISSAVTQTAISNLHIWNESSSSLRLKWTPPNYTPRTYRIYRSTDGGAFTEVTPTPKVLISKFVDTGLSSASKYKYQVRAIYGSGAEGAVSNSSNMLIPGTGFLIDYIEGNEGIVYGGPYGAGLTPAFSTAVKTEGTRSMQLAFAYAGGWGGAETGTLPVKVDVSPYNAVKVSVNGGVLSGKAMALQLKETGRTEGNETWQSPLITTTNTAWTEYTLNFSDFTRVDVDVAGGGNFRLDTHTIGGYGLAFNSQSATSTYYVDKIYLGNTAATVDVPAAEYPFGEILPAVDNHRFKIGPIPVSYAGYSTPWTIRIWTNNGGTAGLRGADGVTYIPLKVWCANYGPTASVPDEENDAYWINNETGWFRVPEYSEMDPGNVYSWRRLSWGPGGELTNPFNIYLAIDVADATTQYYQTNTLTVEYINE